MNINFANKTKRNATLNALGIEKADNFALSMKAIIDELRTFGFTYHQMAEELNDMGTCTPKGCYWAYKSVRNLCARLDAIAAKQAAEDAELADLYLAFMD